MIVISSNVTHEVDNLLSNHCRAGWDLIDYVFLLCSIVPVELQPVFECDKQRFNRYKTRAGLSQKGG